MSPIDIPVGPVVLLAVYSTVRLALRAIWLAPDWYLKVLDARKAYDAYHAERRLRNQQGSR